MRSLLGIDIIENPLCVKVRVCFELRRHPLKKRRRNWSVVRVESTEPAVYMMAGRLFVHPSLVAKLHMELGAKAA